MTETDDLLHKLLFGGLPLDRFEAKYIDDVGEPSDEVCAEVRTAKLPKQGLCTLFVLVGGLTVVENARSQWSLYESRERVEEREYYSRWQSFIRAGWSSALPKDEGTYPVRDCLGVRGHDRTLKRVNGRLVDVTRDGGFVGGGKVTEWRGDFWREPYPPLRGAI